MPHDMLQIRSADGLGYRAKIGLIVPATNTICQPECDAMRPVGVTNHVARMPPVPRGAETGDMEQYAKSLLQDTSLIREAIASVGYCKPDLIVLGHSIDTFRGGIAGAAAMKTELEGYAGQTPVILPSEAFRMALRALGLQPGQGKRIAIMSPYWPPADAQVRRFFTEAGYDVCKVLGLRCPGAVAIAETPRETIIAALRELADEKPDIIIEPGTNLALATLSDQASVWLGLPVISCNIATYWHALRSLGIRDQVAGYGPLFAQH